MYETKTLTFKANADGSLGRFSGIASTYGNVDQVGDVMVAGCFNRSIANKGTHFPLLWSHNMDEVIGSFDVTSMDGGLQIEGKFNMDVQRGKEGYHLLKAGDIQGLSIGFQIKDCDYDNEGHRLIKEADLWEVSLVAFPCNTLAMAEAKSMIVGKGAKYDELDDETKEALKQLIKDALADMEEPEDEKGEEEEPEKDPKEQEKPTEESEDESEKSEEDEEEDEVKAVRDIVAELKGLHKELIA